MRAGDVTIGEFRCAPTESNFAHAGVATRHCFVFPRRGVWIQHEDQAAFVADPTRVTLYNPKQNFERRVLDPVGDHSDWITLPEAVAREVIALYDRAAAESASQVFRHTHAPADADLCLAQRQLYDYVRRHPSPDQLYVEESAVHLFARTIGALYDRSLASAGRELTPRQHEIVENVRAYLGLTFTRHHTLGTIARAVETSVFHLCRVFRRGTGTTIHAYRHHLRLRHSLEYLGHGTDLLELALHLGYSSHSHFTAAFRGHFGAAPSRLRRRDPQTVPARSSAPGASL